MCSAFASIWIAAACAAAQIRAANRVNACPRMRWDGKERGKRQTGKRRNGRNRKPAHDHGGLRIAALVLGLLGSAVSVWAAPLEETSTAANATTGTHAWIYGLTLIFFSAPSTSRMTSVYPKAISSCG